MRIIVEFDMWGQRCVTMFDYDSELDPFTWINTCVEKGWMLPIEVRQEDGVVLFNQEQLAKRYKDV